MSEPYPTLHMRWRAKAVNDGAGFGGQWIIGFPKQAPSGVTRIDVWNERIGYGGFKVDPETLGQSTGLTDIDGTEIFGGDVVEFYGKFSFQNRKKTQRGVVRFSRLFGFGGFRIAIKDAEGLWNDATHTTFGHHGNGLLIIGNIHDDPSLAVVK